MKKVLVLEDESSIRSFIVINLRRAGYEVVEAETGEEALEKLKIHSDVRVALLDIMLPGPDGYELLDYLRSVQTPVIFLTAKTAVADRVRGLHLGADDYITKPFGMMEFVARVKAVLRRSARQNEDKELHYDELYLNVGRHEVHYREEKVDLTRKEFELLQYLMENKGLVMTRNQILCHVWGYDFDGETRTVDVHVRTLRQKLGDAGNQIETVRGLSLIHI